MKNTSLTNDFNNNQNYTSKKQQQSLTATILKTSFFGIASE